MTLLAPFPPPPESLLLSALACCANCLRVADVVCFTSSLANPFAIAAACDALRSCAVTSTSVEFGSTETSTFCVSWLGVRGLCRSFFTAAATDGRVTCCT